MINDQNQVEFREIHWLMDMIQSIDVGLVVLDREMRVQLWNNFMENHSGVLPQNIIGKNILKVFDNMPSEWLARKLETVCLLESNSFTTWEQRPYLFKFKNYHPITGSSSFMYQNITFMPLLSSDGKVDRVGMIIYDVTDIAISKLNIEKANGELETLSRTDGLTQLNNRSYWEECLSREFLRAKRTNQPCTLIMFDIDHFKKVNDTYGHQAGDEVIKETSLSLRKASRLTDISGRYGGEEFTVILVDTVANNGKIFAERLRQEVESHTINYDGQKIQWTISLGIAEYSQSFKNHKAWIENADQALYIAKESGRNKSIIYNENNSEIENKKEKTKK